MFTVPESDHQSTKFFCIILFRLDLLVAATEINSGWSKAQTVCVISMLGGSHNHQKRMTTRFTNNAGKNNTSDQVKEPVRTLWSTPSSSRCHSLSHQQVGRRYWKPPWPSPPSLARKFHSTALPRPPPWVLLGLHASLSKFGAPSAGGLDPVAYRAAAKEADRGIWVSDTKGTF